MPANFRIVAEMSIWSRKATFSFSNISGGGYMGELTFPEKLNLGDIMRDIWRKTAGDVEFPLGDIDLEIESVKAAMNEAEDKSSSLVMFELIIEGIQIGVYFVKDNIKKEEATVFLIKSRDGIKIDSLPGVDTRLPEPIQANLSLSLCNAPTEFKLGDKIYTYQKGFGFDCYINIPEVLDEHFVYTYTPKKKQKKTSNTADKDTGATPKKDTDITKNEDNKSSYNEGIADSLSGKDSRLKWKKVNKKLGKVATIHRIGNGYFDPYDANGSNKKVIAQIDLSVYISKLQISLIGLKLIIDPQALLSGLQNAVKVYTDDASDATKKEAGIMEKTGQAAKHVLKAFDLGLDGLAFGLHTNSFSLGGLFLKHQVFYRDKYYDQYVGGLIIKLSKIELAGIGAYGKIDGFTSLFIYAIIGFPGGIGPGFFMIQKLALGFGYNRRVVIPSIENVASFPLVSLAMSDQLSKGNPVDTLTQMVPMIVENFPPKKSEFFFAFGIKFNAFQLIDGFILLIVSWGYKLRFDVLGLLTFAKPASHPVVAIRIAIRATVIPEDGIVEVEGRITEGSYIFSKNARLQGGFAFYSWTKDYKRISAGDFVMSLGGYHPNFRKPAHYPSVPRFGLNWRVSSKLSIKAEAYLALTPCFFMMGARLSAIYKSGNLNAWLEIYSNFIIQYNPFAYDAEMGIRVGGRYSTWIKTFSFDIEAHAHIWGPDFGGTARVKYKCVSKTVKFGKKKRPGMLKISWEQFRDDMLPPTKEILSLQVVSGKVAENEDKSLSVNPGTFVLEASSKIPVSKLKLPRKKNKIMERDAFGVYPVRNATEATADFSLSVSFTPFGKAEPVKYEDFEISWTEERLPAALWSKTKVLPLNASDEEKLIAAVRSVSVMAKKMEPLDTVKLKKLPEFTNYPRPDVWNWKPPNYAFSTEEQGYELKTTFGLLRDEFMEGPNEKAKDKETDFSEYALRKDPAMVSGF